MQQKSLDKAGVHSAHSGYGPEYCLTGLLPHALPDLALFLMSSCYSTSEEEVIDMLYLPVVNEGTPFVAANRAKLCDARDAR